MPPYMMGDVVLQCCAVLEQQKEVENLNRCVTYYSALHYKKTKQINTKKNNPSRGNVNLPQSHVTIHKSHSHHPLVLHESCAVPLA